MASNNSPTANYTKPFEWLSRGKHGNKSPAGSQATEYSWMNDDEFSPSSGTTTDPALWWKSSSAPVLQTDGLTWTDSEGSIGSNVSLRLKDRRQEIAARHQRRKIDGDISGNNFLHWPRCLNIPSMVLRAVENIGSFIRRKKNISQSAFTS